MMRHCKTCGALLHSTMGVLVPGFRRNEPTCEECRMKYEEVGGLK